MPAQPVTLILESIDKLEQLSALLAADLRAGPSPAELPGAQRLGKEVLLGISVLLPKLRAVHRIEDLGSRPGPAVRCPSCED